MLEIGCCGGLFLDEARKRGWDVMGTEISQNAVEYCRNQLKLEICDSTDLSLINSDNKFDVVVLFDILEHMESPSETIKYLKENLLKSNGLIAVEIPNVHTFYTPYLKYINLDNSHFMYQHYYYYSKETFKLFIDKQNLSIIDFKYGHRIYPLAYCFDMLLKRNKKIQEGVHALLKFIKLDKIYINAAMHEFFYYICKNDTL